MSISWDNYFINIAKAVSQKSHCLSWKAGVVLVKDRQIISTGYNGPPSGYSHCEFTLVKGELEKEGYKTQPHFSCPRKRLGFKSGEGLEYCPASHAETNAIVQASKKGVSVEGATLYCAFNQIPCRECSKLIVNSGIKKVILMNEINDYPQTGLTGRDILTSCGVEMEIAELEKKIYSSETIKITFDGYESNFIRDQAKHKKSIIENENSGFNSLEDEIGGQYAVNKMLGTWPSFNVWYDGGVDGIYKGKKWDAKQSAVYHNLAASNFVSGIYYIAVYGTMPTFEILGYVSGEAALKCYKSMKSTVTQESFLLVDQENLRPIMEFIGD
jgi:dCMP deaminase